MRICIRLTLVLIVTIWLAGSASADGFRVLTGHAFDGQPININVSGLKKVARGLEADVVGVIMRHSGLPQNFTLYADPGVANAAAVILIDKDGHGKRALVCNELFMKTARRASAEGNWAPISIVAHEIGHHLAGQTPVNEDWQPRGELAADAFSGFILYKLGAKLGQASRAVNTLATKRDDALSRDKRLKAVRQGWMLACRQQADQCQVDETAFILPTPATIKPNDAGAPVAPAVPSPVAGGPADVLPLPDRQDIPVKFGRFVIDELGALDRAARAGFERKMFDLAAKNQVEIVTIVSKDLHGLTADEYAQAMLRQLAVGSLDVASGAVLLVAPHEKQVGIALAPGLAAVVGDKAAMVRDQLKNFEEFSLLTCQGNQGNCRAEQTMMLFRAATSVADMAGGWDFSVSYPPGGRLPTGSVGLNCLHGKILGHDATPQVVPPVAPAPTKETTMKMVDEGGREALLSLSPEVEKTLPLITGKSYQFIARELPSSERMRRFEVLSYTALP